MIWFSLTLPALAFTPADLDARLAEVAALRAARVASNAPSLTAEQYARAAAGEVVTSLSSVPGPAARKVIAVGVVDAPIDRFWAAINDDPGKVAYSSLEHAEVLAGGVCGPSRSVFQYLGVSLASDRWWVFDVTTNTAAADASSGAVREMMWRSRPAGELPATAAKWAEDGMQVEFTEGAWFLVKLDDAHTLVEYYAWTDPGGAVPAGIASSFAGGAVPELYDAMTRFAAASPACL